jgi:hypothetical protein
MANPDSVSQFYLDSFGNSRIGFASAVSLSATGNAVATIPFLSGGLTKNSAVANSGGVILRRITLNNPSATVSNANVSILTSNDGNTSNAVVLNALLSNLTAAGTFTDLTIAAPYLANTVVSGLNTNALFVKVNTASGNNNTVNISVFGDVVTF